MNTFTVPMILGPATLSIIHPGSVDSKRVVSHMRTTTALTECSFSFIDIIVLFCCGVVYFFLLLFHFSFSLFFSNHQHVQLLIFHLEFNILWGHWLTPNDTMRMEKIRLPTRKRKKEQSSRTIKYEKA